MIQKIENAHGPYVRDITWSSNGLTDQFILASGGENKELKIWKIDLSSGQNGVELVFTKAYDSAIWKTGFNYSGNLLAVSFTNKEDVNIVEVLSEKEKNQWEPVTKTKNEN